MCAVVLEKTCSLSECLKAEVNALMTVCRERGDEGVPFPVDEEDSYYYLLWKDDDNGHESGLIGVSAVLPLSDESAECIAYVHPDERRKGYFSQMILPVISEDFSDLELVFPVRGNDKSVQAALGCIGAEYDRTEYRMERDISSGNAGSVPDSSDSESLPGVYLYPADDEPPAGCCRLEKVSADSVCLYEVEVRPERRGQGCGTAMILSLAAELEKAGVRKIIVHVSAANLPAVSLYEKTGFRTTETLLYYIF